MKLVESRSTAVQRESTLGSALEAIVGQCGAAIELWPLVCMAQAEFGDPSGFIERHWIRLRDRVQEVRSQVQNADPEPPVSAFDQVHKLWRVVGELRETFDYFVNFQSTPLVALEAAVARLARLWQDLRMHVWLLSTLVPLAEPVKLSSEREGYYQAILDRLFDQLAAARP